MKDKIVKIVNIAGSILFVIFAAWLLGKDKQDMLFRIQQLSIFVQTKDFFSSFFEHPGMFLTYMGSFLTQFFHYPLVGISIFVLLLMLVQYTVFSACKVNKNLYLFSFIPSALFLLLVLMLDYEIYVIHIRDLIYSQMLGFLFALSALRIYRIFSRFWIKILFLALVVIVGYYLAGFYALAAAVYICTYELLFNKKYIIPLTGIVLAIAIPFLYYKTIYNYLNIEYIYGYGLPVFEQHSAVLRIPGIQILISVIPVLLLFVNRFVKIAKATSGVIIVNILSLVICFYVVLKYTNRDENLHAQLKIERALGKRDWNEILEIAYKTKSPNRAIIMYRNIALHRKNILCDRMFFYPYGYETPKSTGKEITTTKTCAVTAFYHYGLLNYSYRWAMELIVQYGMNADYLQYMTKIALINNEPELARKYLNVLNNTMFYKDWAKKYGRYIDNKKLFEIDPEYQEISDLLHYENNWQENSGNVELCILTHYAELTSGTQSMLELAMSSILILKLTPVFWEKFDLYIQINNRIPLHIQETALLYSATENVNLSHVSFDNEVMGRFNQFVTLTNQHNGGVQNEKTQGLAKTYHGNTFWYYYFYEKKISLN